MTKIFKSAGNDLSAALVVFLIAIPLCLGIALASGLPEFSGLVAGMAGGIVIGLISKSHLSVSGPAAGLTAVVAAAVMKLPALEAFFLAVVIAGLLQIIMGVLKLGVIGDYIPNSVIKGMLAAIGIILILKQFPYLVGYKKEYRDEEGFFEVGGSNTFSSIIDSINNITPMAFLIGIVGLGILMIYESKFFKGKKVFQILSGPLVVVIIGTLLNIWLGNSDHMLAQRESELVKVPVATSLNEAIGFFKFPNFSFLGNFEVWKAGITIALVASLETLLGIEAVDKLDPYKRVTPPNRELIAQGSGNIISGMLGGLPLTSVIVRSSANVQAGAKTKMSAIFHGVFILIAVFFLPQVLNMIPKAALAAILIFTGYKLAKVSIFKDYYREGWAQFMPFLVTVVAIIFTDLLTGVMIGIGFGLFYTIRNNFRTAIYTQVKGDHHYLRFRKDVSFFNKPILKKQLEAIPADSRVTVDLTQAEFIDKDIIDTVNEYLAHAELRNIAVDVKRTTYNESHRMVLSSDKNYYSGAMV